MSIYIAPDKPQVNEIPVYSATTQALLRFTAAIDREVSAEAVLCHCKDCPCPTTTVSFVPQCLVGWVHNSIQGCACGETPHRIPYWRLPPLGPNPERSPALRYIMHGRI